jgi:hypothetical protein
MEKLTIAQASAFFSVSKEAIHNRIRRGTLNCVIENGVKYIIIDENSANNKTQTKNKTTSPSPKSHSNTDDSKYYKYIEDENERLRKRIEALEGETTQLRSQREKMLIEEKNNIESIYRQRDEQLKSVLNVVATKFLAHINVDSLIEEVAVEEAPVDATIPAEPFQDSLPADIVQVQEKQNLISLKKFLKLKEFSQKKKNKIVKRFTKLAGNNKRIVVKKDKLYLDPTHYDYKDLL